MENNQLKCGEYFFFILFPTIISGLPVNFLENQIAIRNRASRSRSGNEHNKYLKQSCLKACVRYLSVISHQMIAH